MIAADRWTALWPKRFFYGWCIVAVASTVSFTQVGEFNPVLAVFMRPLADEFGWSRAQVSAAIALGSIGGAFLSPLVGPLLDRRGPRLVLVLGQIVFGGALIASALVSELWQFYLSYSVGRAVVMGVTSISVSVAVANWFRQDRALAMSITQLGTRIGQAVLPLAVQFLIETAGWRWAWAFLGLLVLAVGVIPSALFIRQRPEDLGLRPDGVAKPETAAALAEAEADDLSDEASYTLAEARRTRALWLLVLATGQAFLVGAGINLHMLPFLQDQGIPDVAAVGALSLFAAVAGAGGLLWGYVARRMALRNAIAITFALAGAGVLALLQVRSAEAAYAFALYYGLCFGGWAPLTNSLWADYFGRRSVGAITGFVSPFQLLANSFGPFFGGLMYDLLGNYQTAFLIFAAFYFMAAVWMLLAKPPIRSAARSG